MSQATSPPRASRMAWRRSAACGASCAPPCTGSGTSPRGLPSAEGLWGSPFNMRSDLAKLSSRLRSLRISLGGDGHVARHDLCPLRQGAPDLCDSPGCLRAAPGCATLGVSTTALYNKLARVETGVSAALVRDSAVLAEPVVKALRANHPRWLPGYQIMVLDGNHLSSTEHRLKALRSTWAAPFFTSVRMTSGSKSATFVLGR